ncbi:hypothetical protein JI664_08430 [Rhodobacter sp. NTK016B]|uniref:hypothetical protein n=2 Tax=Bacteria TaxID=2 RepID=UPI001A8F633C|nr:hypothetical protein [Rhodobacter sp. NTK016B]MBN8291985.1 hypothetical protein [Rhodobacter sp. NTK016B]
MRFSSLILSSAAFGLFSPLPGLADVVEVRPPNVAELSQERRQTLLDDVVAMSVSLEVCDTTPSDLTVEEAEILWISGLALGESLGIPENDLYATHYPRARAMFDSQPARCAQVSGNLRPLVMTLVGYGAGPVLSE